MVKTKISKRTSLHCCKRFITELQLLCVLMVSVCWKLLAKELALNVLHIWWDPVKWKIIHSFIILQISGEFDVVGIDIIVYGNFGSTRKKTKEQTFVNIVFKTSSTTTGLFYPYSTSKSFESSKVIFFYGAVEIAIGVCLFRVVILNL